MTELQIKYQALQLDRERVAKELELNERQVSEVERHNLETEAVARENLNVSWHQAESTRMNAEANVMNAETNRLNYGVNLMNAQTNRYNAETNRLNYGVNLMNAETNRYNAETNRLNYGVNLMNAETNARNAAVNERNAAVNEGNLALAQQIQPYRIAQIEAETSYTYAQTQDLSDKHEANYWESSAWSNYNSRIGSSLITSASKLVGTGAAASSTAAFMQRAATYYPTSWKTTGSNSTALSTHVLSTGTGSSYSSIAPVQAAGAVSPDVLGAGYLAHLRDMIRTYNEQYAMYKIQHDAKLKPWYEKYKQEKEQAQSSSFSEWLNGFSWENAANNVAEHFRSGEWLTGMPTESERFYEWLQQQPGVQ